MTSAGASKLAIFIFAKAFHRLPTQHVPLGGSVQAPCLTAWVPWALGPNFPKRSHFASLPLRPAAHAPFAQLHRYVHHIRTDPNMSNIGSRLAAWSRVTRFAWPKFLVRRPPTRSTNAMLGLWRERFLPPSPRNIEANKRRVRACCAEAYRATQATPPSNQAKIKHHRSRERLNRQIGVSQAWETLSTKDIKAVAHDCLRWPMEATGLSIGTGTASN